MNGLVIGAIVVVVIIIVIAVIATRGTSGGGGGAQRCTSDIDCSGSTPACDPVSGNCVACIAVNDTDKHCPADLPYCVQQQCAFCTETAGCPAGLKCDKGSACKVCRNDGDCSSPNPRCLDDGSKCVECFSARPSARRREGFDYLPKKSAIEALARATRAPRARAKAGAASGASSYCSGNLQFCDDSKHQCVQCLQDTDCGPAGVCVNDACQRCSGDSTGCPQGQFCTPDGSTCVGCRTSADCGSSAPACVSSQCAVCNPGTNEGCASNEKCLGGTSCVQCIGNGDCPSSNPICGTDHVCHVCTGDSTGCPAGEFCMPDGSKCVVCRSDTDCTSPGLGRCLPDGSACVQC